MSDDEDRGESPDYEVGYRKPPRHSQYKLGQSGNLKGRPRRARNLSTLLGDALNERLVVTERGRRRTKSVLEVIVAQLLKQSLGANLKATAMTLSLVAQLESAAAAQGVAAEVLSEADHEVMRSLIERMKGD